MSYTFKVNTLKAIIGGATEGGGEGALAPPTFFQGGSNLRNYFYNVASA